MFSEVSPRPHDTGMVTMATQVWSEFALHARAILGLPIPSIRRYAAGASVALRAEGELASPVLDGLAEAYATPDIDVRFFGKPTAGPRRRLGVVLATADTAEAALAKAKKVAGVVKLRDGEQRLIGAATGTRDTAARLATRAVTLRHVVRSDRHSACKARRRGSFAYGSVIMFARRRIPRARRLRGHRRLRRAAGRRSTTAASPTRRRSRAPR